MCVAVASCQADGTETEGEGRDRRCMASVGFFGGFDLGWLGVGLGWFGLVGLGLVVQGESVVSAAVGSAEGAPLFGGAWGGAGGSYLLACFFSAGAWRYLLREAMRCD